MILKKKQIISFILIAVFALVLITGCAQQSKSPEELIEKTKNSFLNKDADAIGQIVAYSHMEKALSYGVSNMDITFRGIAGANDPASYSYVNIQAKKLASFISPNPTLNAMSAITFTNSVGTTSFDFLSSKTSKGWTFSDSEFILIASEEIFATGFEATLDNISITFSEKSAPVENGQIQIFYRGSKICTSITIVNGKKLLAQCNLESVANSLSKNPHVDEYSPKGSIDFVIMSGQKKYVGGMYTDLLHTS